MCQCVKDPVGIVCKKGIASCHSHWVHQLLTLYSADYSAVGLLSLLEAQTEFGASLRACAMAMRRQDTSQKKRPVPTGGSSKARSP